MTKKNYHELTCSSTVPAFEEEDLEHAITKITVLDLTIILVVSKPKIFRYLNVGEIVKEIQRKKGNATYDFQFL